jgi:hypothetical protein
VFGWPGIQDTLPSETPAQQKATSHGREQAEAMDCQSLGEVPFDAEPVPVKQHGVEEQGGAQQLPSAVTADYCVSTVPLLHRCEDEAAVHCGTEQQNDVWERSFQHSRPHSFP